MKFSTTYRNKGRMFTTVKAETERGRARMSVCIDNETGKALYPMKINIWVPECMGMAFSLDSETNSSCAFPPSVPGSVVTDMAELLKMFHGIVDAARDFIKDEQGSQKTEEFDINRMDPKDFFDLANESWGKSFDCIIDEKDDFQVWQHMGTGRYYYIDTEEFGECFELECVGQLEYDREKTQVSPKGRLASALECLVCGDVYPESEKGCYMWFIRKEQEEE